MGLNDVVVMDLETSSLNPRQGEIRMVAFAYSNQEVTYRKTVDDEVREILKDHNVIKMFHNAKFDVGYLRTKGYEVNNYGCTLVMAQVLGEIEVSLKALTKKHFEIDMDKTMQHSDNWKTTEFTQDHIEYALKDVEYTRALYYKFSEELRKRDLLGVYERERGALDAIVMLETKGIKMKFEEWNEELNEDRKLSEDIEEEIKSILNKHELNINSTKQLTESLFEYGIKLCSTSDDELAKFSDEYEVIRLLRKYRKLKTKIKTYGEKLREYIDEDGRIRANWRLIGAQSGRMACNNPPLQAMPSKSREFFVPEEGYKYVVADYSQVELRILAKVSMDSTLINYFKNNIDLHKGTASLVFKKPLDEVTKEERQVGKSLNFGIVYGITAYGIQKNLRKCGISVSLEEAEEYRIQFLNSYPKVREMQDALLRADTIKTLGGQRWQCRNLTATQRLNLPIKGSAAEVLKEALALLVQKIKPTWKIAAIVHDEILLEVPENDAEKAKEMLEKAMIDGMEKIVAGIPIVVDISINNNWCK